ncbi:MAG: hypothetical protein OCD00_16505 [Colwellia sp.]
MNPVKQYFYHSSKLLSVFLTLIISMNTQATEFEITPYIGQTVSSDLIGNSSLNTIKTSSENNFGLSFAWQDSARGQGQILVNYVSRDFTSDLDQSTHTLDTFYAHFSGIALFKERNYITTVGLGLGGTYFDTDNNSELYPSMTAAIGTRYEISDNLAFVTEIRAYATLVDNEDNLFCTNDICFANFDGSIWFDANISVGLAYKF